MPDHKQTIVDAGVPAGDLMSFEANVGRCVGFVIAKSPPKLNSKQKAGVESAVISEWLRTLANADTITQRFETLDHEFRTWDTTRAHTLVGIALGRLTLREDVPDCVETLAEVV